MYVLIGSYQCRAGWAVDSKPRLVFKNLVAKQRNKKEVVQVGNDITSMEIVKWQVRSQFDANVVTHYDTQVIVLKCTYIEISFSVNFVQVLNTDCAPLLLKEHVLDHIFSHLGIDSHGSVDHPLVLSESACNPNYSRQRKLIVFFRKKVRLTLCCILIQSHA